MQQLIQHYYNLVEGAIKGFGVNPAAMRGQQSGQWNLTIGPTSVLVDVFSIESTPENQMKRGYFSVMSVVCDLPVNDLHLFTKELLEANHLLFGGLAFTIIENKAYLKYIRDLEDLDNSEVVITFDRIWLYTEEWSKKLKAKYFAL